MNKKIIIKILILISISFIAGLFFIERQAEKIKYQSWKTVSVNDYGVSIDYPSNLYASYSYREGVILFYKEEKMDTVDSRVRIDLLTNTKDEHRPNGIQIGKVEHLPWFHTFMTGSVIKGSKFVVFTFRDFDVNDSKRMVNSVKFF